MQSNSLGIWLKAFRLRTLPLALSSIFMGNFLAYSKGNFQASIFFLSVLTTIFLQILSNLANDYGDSIHGADSEERTWTKRSVQSAAISSQTMKNAMFLFVLLSLLSGIGLLWVSFASNLVLLGIFLAIGVLAILAAITYTAGFKPYGYMGLGDISVLLFFGLVGVGGSYFLQTQYLDWRIFLPALSCGFFATAVLNVNNIRDIETDSKAGKRSIPVRLGRKKAVFYHWFLLSGGLGAAVVFHVLNPVNLWQWLFLLVSPFLLRNAWAVKNIHNSHDLDPYLKQMAVSTLLFVILFGVGLLLAKF